MPDLHFILVWDQNGVFFFTTAQFLLGFCLFLFLFTEKHYFIVTYRTTKRGMPAVFEV